VGGVKGLGGRGQGFGWEGSRVWMGGVNHCRSHCRVATFRGMMYGGKYSAVIGREPCFFVCAQCEFSGYGIFLANHNAGFLPVHQTTELHQTTVADPCQLEFRV